MGTICTNKTIILCPFKSKKGMMNRCYDYGGVLGNCSPLAPKSLRTPAIWNTQQQVSQRSVGVKFKLDLLLKNNNYKGILTCTLHLNHYISLN